jgi:hypothetical protein
MSVYPSVCPHGSTPLLEPIVGQQWNPTISIVGNHCCATMGNNCPHLCATMGLRITLEQKYLRSLLEDTVVQQLHELTLVQEWPRTQ